jgi:hypothetical protein
MAISTGSVLAAAGYPPYWASVTERIMRQTSTSTGKQYEIDQAATGEAHPVLDNRDAAFSPVNSSSPYSPQVTAFKPFRIRAQYPATVQMLTGDQASMGDFSGLAAGTLASALAMASFYDAGAHIVTDGTAWQGTRVMSATAVVGSTLGQSLVGASQVASHAGKSHAFQCRVRVPAGAVSPTMHAAIGWVDVNGNGLSTSSGTATAITGGSATWVQLTVAATPPAGAAGLVVEVVLDTLPGTFTLQTDGWQLELAAAPSTWVMPGTWYPVFFGGTARWPQIYDMGGTFAQTVPDIVDAFALLAGTYPQPPFFVDVLALNPAFLFALNDPATSTQCVDATGNLLPAPVGNTQYGAGSLTFGNGITAAVQATGQFLGYPGPVATFNNTATGVNAAATYIDISRAGNLGPPASGAWTRFLAFRAPVNQTNEVTMWAASGPTYSSTSPAVAFHILGSADVGGHPGFLDLTIDQSNGSAASHVPVSAASVCDGNWHYVFLTCDGAGNYKVYSDTIASNPFVITLTNPAGPGFNGITTDLIGVFVETGTQRAYNGFVGDLGAVAQWNIALTSTQINNLAASWRTAWQGDTSGTRYNRVLAAAGYPGQTNLDTGATLDMGPATDIDGKTDALTLLQNVVTTENGTHYVSPAAPVVFEARTRRYNQLTPTYTFGENTAGGEWPYEDVAFDFDTTHVIGQAQITQNSTGQIFIANSPTTLAPNYRPTYQRTINVTNPQECIDAANYLANRYAAPQLRVQKIRLHPAAVTGMWPVALSLAISTRVRVMRRPPAYAPGTAIQFDGFIENIKWSIDWDSGDAVVDLEISPANLQLYWVLSALHTTMHTASNPGDSTITLNALSDSASNPAAASFCSGLNLVVALGGELRTVQSVSATSPGYTTFTVTFTTPLTNGHPANSLVFEQLATGTDPTAWDTASILGTSTTLAY